METWRIVGIVLLAVLVGAALPVLITLRSMLREARTFLATVGQSTERSLRELSTTLERVNRTHAQIEARHAAGASPPHLAESPMAGVAAAVGALAAPALLEWLMALAASRKGPAAPHDSAGKNGT